MNKHKHILPCPTDLQGGMAARQPVPQLLALAAQPGDLALQLSAHVLAGGIGQGEVAPWMLVMTKHVEEGREKQTQQSAHT